MKNLLSLLSLIFFISVLILFYSCSEEPIVTVDDSPTVSYAGKTYHTVQIGNQWWLKENLDVGIMITGDLDQTDNGIIEKYCYDNDSNNCAKYGGLYQWNEAMQYLTEEGAQGICPPGWHIPTLEEFKTLTAAVDSNGNALKAGGQGTGEGTGKNTSGFSALLAGYRYYIGGFNHLGADAEFWSSTTANGSSNVMNLNYEFVDIYLLSYLTDFGFCVRCLKD